MFVDFNILNQLGSPSINSNTFANRPSAGQVGRLFVSTDTFEIYRDTGTGWDLIGGPGSSTVTGSGAAGQVTYWTGTNSVGGENNLWWDAANNRFGVNTNTPTAAAEVVQTDGVALYSNFTTNAGSGPGTTAILAKNTTNSSGYAAVIEENTPNVSAGQYPVLIRHTLSSGTAAANMATGIHFGLPDDAGTERINQFSMDTVDAAAATYSSRYRFLLRSNGAAVTPLYITGTGLGVFTATPGAALDIHSTGTIAQFNTTSGTGNNYIAFQRTGTGVWRIGDTYNGGNNFFELHNTVLNVDAMEFQASTNKSTFQAQETYSTGLARGNYFDYNLTVAGGGSFSSPNAITALGASLDLTLQGSVTIPSGARSGLDAYNSIGFTTTGTLTQNQGSQLRTYSNLTTGWAFNGTQTGTITHLSGIHVRFPDNTGSAMAITNNYGVLINDQTANTGTVTYTNRWGLYQEGASDLNYMAANLLLGSTTNSGERLQVTGNQILNGVLTLGTVAIPASGAARLFARNTDSNLYIQSGTGNTTYLLDSSQNSMYLVSPTAHNWLISNSVKMLLDSSGNLALGVTPSAWGSGYLGFQVGPAGSQMAYSNNNFVGVNYYFDGSNYKAIQTGAASRIEFSGNTIEFKNAASVSAGANQTFNSRAILDASGNLGIGTNAPSELLTVAGNILVSYANPDVNGIKINATTGTNAAAMVFTNTSGNFFVGKDSSTGNRITGIANAAAIWSEANTSLVFGTNNANRTVITVGGNFLIGTTTDAGYKLQVNGVVTAKDNVRITPTNTTSVSTSATTISNTSNTYGAMAIVWGADSSGNVFTDLLFYSLSAVNVIYGQSVSGSPAGRTYTMSLGNLQLAMSSGTYTIRFQSIFAE